MKKVISVRFKENGKSYYFDPAGADIKTGEYEKFSGAVCQIRNLCQTLDGKYEYKSADSLA